MGRKTSGHPHRTGSSRRATCATASPRDDRVTWLEANTAYQRVSVTAQLLQQASLALDLAQTRYNLGLSSIVELSQAQLQQTDAQIGNTNARYAYLSTLSVLRYQVGR